MISMEQVLSKWDRIAQPADKTLLSRLIASDRHKLVVLDDDPTGTQTVHDVSVYTKWDVNSMVRAMAEDRKMFYLLTNSRGLIASESEHIHREIVKNVYTAAKQLNLEPIMISRSDSTLRGHYPMETDIIREVTEKESGCPVNGEILFPFFKEGGRFTIDSIHYVLYGDDLVPAAETEFAADKTFGYTNSFLPDYIEEKTNGTYPADRVIRITLDQMRSNRIDEIDRLLSTPDGFHRYCVDALDYSDVTVFCIALYQSLNKGRRFVFRTAASLVKVLGGISDQPLLTFGGRKSENGGLVVIGSHTEKTTRQLEQLLKMENTVAIPFDTAKVLESDAALTEEINRCLALEEKVISRGGIAVCYTDRKVITKQNDTKEDALLRSIKISSCVQQLVSKLKITPSFLVAKGGITSSDIATEALGVQKAEVLGQIIPGVPVWQLGEESLFPSIPYVIFPGNVGNDNSLLEAVQKLLS